MLHPYGEEIVCERMSSGETEWVHRAASPVVCLSTESSGNKMAYLTAGQISCVRLSGKSQGIGSDKVVSAQFLEL